jgi:ABC-type phosphate transport system substrate-binding protein
MFNEKVDYMKTVTTLIVAITLMSMSERSELSPLQGPELAIIVNKDNPIEKLSVPEVRLYWMRRGTQKNWSTLKTMVLPTDRKTSCAEKTAFYKSIIKISEAETDAYFSAKQYQGGENPPVKFATDREIIQYVTENKAALGFVNVASLTNDNKAGIKVVCSVAQ